MHGIHVMLEQAFPKKQSLYGSSLDTSLYYHTLYHYKATGDSSLSSLVQVPALCLLACMQPSTD